MNDEHKIFELYLEMATEQEQPKMSQNANGSITWWHLHGKLHRENAPAVEWADGDKAWWLHGKRHREDGAAIEWADGSKRWYLHGKGYASAEAWAEALLKQRNEPHDAAAVDAFLKPILQKYFRKTL